MEHTQIVTASELEEYAERRDSEAVIPELVCMLVNESAPDLAVCRIPYGDNVNQPGWDGLVETATGFRQFVPQGKSFWEIGTGSHPQTKATSDFKKRTRNKSAADRQAGTYVFVTPRGAGSGGWQEPAQSKWKRRRERFGWHRMNILDGQQMADWLREFPALGKWFLKQMGSLKTAAGFATPAEHWENLRELANDGDPSLPNKIFLVGRDRPCEELHRLFRGETKQLLLATESEQDAEDFVAAFLESLDVDTRRSFSNRCLFVRDADAWLSFANLKSSHVLVASPKLGMESDEQLHMAAKRRGHGVIIPVFGTWAHGKESLIQLRSPSASTLEITLRECGFESARARELAGAGALSLAALKRYLRGLGGVPPYATWPNARVLAQAELVGKWQGTNPADRAAMETLLGKSYGEWIEVARDETLRQDTPLIQRNERWTMISRGEAWSALGPRLTNEDLDRFQSLAITVLGERDPKLYLPKDERFAASIRGKALSHSVTIRDGVAESLALLGSRPDALSSCTRGKAEAVASAVVRELLKDADWVKWASLSSYLPMLAEAAPDEFLNAVETALVNHYESPFLGVFAQESTGVGGWNYITGVLWALETLAWHPDYLVRITMILGELAAIDPGGNWANRPGNSLNHIFLPWFPQTAAPVSKRKAAVEALLREQPTVGWKLLVGLLPTMCGTTLGTHRPSWRDFIPQGWKEGATRGDYWEQVSGYAELAVDIAADDLAKLAELVDRLPDLPDPTRSKVLEHLASGTVTALSEGVRLPLWEALVDLAAKHRTFADAPWALPPEAVARIEEAAEKLAPGSAMLLYRRLFSERDFDLYEEAGNYEEQQRKLDQKRQIVVQEILDEWHIGGLLDFVQQVESPRKVGLALGCMASPEVDTVLLPDFLSRTEKALSAFIGNFVWGRNRTEGWPWVDSQLGKLSSTEQRLEFLTLLPFEPETWHRAKTVLADGAETYWKKAAVNPWGLDEQPLVEAAENLVSCGRPHAAISCLYVLVHKKAAFPAEIAVRALTDGLTSSLESSHVDQHEILEVIQWLQENVPAESEDLFRIEWNYLPLLKRQLGGEPKTLERRLASDPGFFCQVIAAVFRPDKEAESKRKVTDADKNIAENAYRLLHGWKTLPGTTVAGPFDGAEFSGWLAEVKLRSTESGHFRIAMSQIGQALSYAAADPGGLWIQESIAVALDARDGGELRSGFTTGLFNMRGVHGYSAGEEERKIAAGYRNKAAALADKGFHRLADAIRKVSESYERDADQLAETSPFDE